MSYIGTVLDYNKYTKTVTAIVQTNQGEVEIPVSAYRPYSMGEDIEVDEELVQGAILDMEEGFNQIDEIEEPKYWWQKD